MLSDLSLSYSDDPAQLSITWSDTAPNRSYLISYVAQTQGNSVPLEEGSVNVSETTEYTLSGRPFLQSGVRVSVKVEVSGDSSSFLEAFTTTGGGKLILFVIGYYMKG